MRRDLHMKYVSYADANLAPSLASETWNMQKGMCNVKIENKRMAQEKRAKDRKKKAMRKQIRKICYLCAALVLFCFLTTMTVHDIMKAQSTSTESTEASTEVEGTETEGTEVESTEVESTETDSTETEDDSTESDTTDEWS